MKVLICSIAVLVLSAVSMVAIDYGLFRMYATPSQNGTSAGDYVKMRTASWQIRGSAKPDLPARDYVADPLVLDEKLHFARNLAAALPAAPNGWTLRRFEKDDFFRLRPEMEHCQGKDLKNSVALNLQAVGGESGSIPCPISYASKGMWVYEKGTKLIAVHMQYRRGKQAKPKGRIGWPEPLILIEFFGENRSNLRTQPFLTRAGVSFGALARRSVSGSHRPLSIMGELNGDGRLRTYVVSNVPSGELKRILMTLDYKMMTALVAPIPAMSGT